MKKVQPGEVLEIKASTWNAFIDAANYVKGVQGNQSAASLSNGLHNGVVFVKNMESATYARFSALVLADIVIKPNVNEPEFRDKIPVFTGRKMTEALEESPYAILLEPVATGKIGRALLLGIVPAKVNITDPEHKFAVPTPNSGSGAMQSEESGVARILWKAGSSGTQWCMLQLGGAGSGGGSGKIALCQVGGGAASSGYSVIVYADGKDSPSTGSGTLFVPELAVNSYLPSNSWVLGHLSMLSVTGGNET